MQSSTPRRLAALALAAGLLTAHGHRASAQVVRLPAEDRPLAGAPAPAFSIGAEEGESWEMLSDVRGVAFDRNDNLYVMDAGNQRVLVFDRTGRFVRQMGKQGDGPGEFQVALAMVVRPDGTVLVFDPLKQSYAVFGPDGAFLRTIALAGDWWPAPTSRLVPHPSGGLVSLMRPSPVRSVPTSSGTQVSTSTTVPLMFDPLDGSTPPRKVFDVPSLTETRQLSQAPQGGENGIVMRMQRTRVFAPQVLWGMLPSGQVALSFTTGYTVRVVDLDGTTLRYIQRPLRPRPVTEEDREREMEERRQRLASGRGQVGVGGGSGASIPTVRMEAPPPEFADTMPVVRRMAVSPKGRIWVGRTGRWWSDDGPIDLITPEGEYLGTITGQKMPDAISPGGLAAYLERDELDVQRIVVRRLPPGWQ